MLSRIKIAWGYWIRWFLLFQLSRFVFLLYHYPESSRSSIGELGKSFLYGARMDASMSSYLLLLPLLFLIAGIFVPFFRQATLYKIYTGIILFPLLLIVFSDMPAYKAWGYRLDASPLKYLSSPKEAFASVSHLPLFWIMLCFVAVYVIVLKIFNRYLENKFSDAGYQQKKILQALIILLITAAQIIPIRGGFQLAPLNQSSVYFSTDNYANHAAVNVSWNFMHSLSHNLNDTGNPFRYMSDSSAKAWKQHLFQPVADTGSVIHLTKTNTPNIILVVWESFTSKAIGHFKNGIEITPGFNRLINEGIYFSDIYATGDRTDKGIVGILSGYPAQPTTSIIKIPQKAGKLPTLPALYAAKGYHTQFYYGGELEFANMKAYLMGSGYQQYVSKDHFAERDQNSKWGAHDGVVKDKVLADLKQTAEPFFCTWLTLSSHEPYETPVDAVIKGSDDASLFLNSLHYSDSCVFDFVEQCKKLPGWNNTLMIIVADHGHRQPGTGKRIDDFRIPVLMLGGALSQQGIKIQTTGSQLDIAHTLLSQSGMDATAFQWSRSLLGNQQNRWAYFCFNNGFGYVEPGKYFLFDNVGKQVIEQSGQITEQDINKGKSLQQETFDDYLRK